MYIRSAEKDEECKYVLIGDDGQVLKKYYDQDEPVDFKKEVVVYVNPAWPPPNRRTRF
jgi:hypothetical protein